MIRTAFALLTLLLASTSLFAQAAEATRAEADQAISDFNKFYKNPNENVRMAAVEDIGDTNHPDVVPLLLQAMKDKSPKVRNAVAPALKKQTTKGALFALTREIGRTRDLETKLMLLETFKVTKPTVAYPKVLEFAKGRTFELKLAAAELLGIMPSEKKKSERALMKLVEDKEAQIRVVAIDALAKLKHPELLDLCLDKMKTDKDWRVQSTAVAAIPRLRAKRSVVPLIEYMPEAKGRIADDVYAALIELTGEDYPPKPDRWMKWWKRLPPTWEPPSEAELDKRRAKLQKSMQAYGGGDESGTPYHGIKTRSQRMVFVIDVSYSMVQKAVLKGLSDSELKEHKERYADGKGGYYERKIDIAREELINVVATLKPHVSFNIIMFNSKVKKWKPRLVKASGRNAAIKFLSKFDKDWVEAQTLSANSGQTNTFAALNAVFGLKDEPQRKPTKNHKVDGDTVFFMTDGLPEVGEITDTDLLLDYFFELNGRAKIVFHVITFGDSNESFLRPIASSSGGQYVQIGR
jgi:HEAT repeat protein/VWA domain-containing protein